jgi:hypothetical protein
MNRPGYCEALRLSGALAALAGFDPHVVGTPPLGLDLPASDIDILCHAPDPADFATALWHAFQDQEAFSLRRWIGSDRPVIASFRAHGWPFEVFGQARPVREQDGWRHFLVERRLLALGGPVFRGALKRPREAGTKTEPAFASVLGLAGDPYRALLELAEESDACLAARLLAAGFPVGGLS